MQKVAYGYVRVSTKRQSEEGVSLESQKNRIRAWAEMNDCNLIGIEEDPGISGGRIDNREGLQRAIHIACEEKAVLIAYSLSRLSRSLKDTLLIAEKLEKAGADLVSLSEKLDTTSASGKMIFRILAVLNEFEREVLSERTSAALQHKKAKGEVYGPIPYGYNRDGNILVKNIEEQEIILMIKAWDADGRSLREIARELEKRKILTKQGKRWYGSTVSGILQNNLHD